MPETIVYNLEVVQIHEHDRDGLLTPLGARECMPEAVREQDTVGQLSQGIMRGLVGKLLLEGLASGDVAADKYNRLRDSGVTVPSNHTSLPSIDRLYSTFSVLRLSSERRMLL